LTDPQPLVPALPQGAKSIFMTLLAESVLTLPWLIRARSLSESPSGPARERPPP